MIDPQWIFILATLLSALGMWLLLPRGAGRGWPIGVLLMAAALGLGTLNLPGLGHWVANSTFFLVAGVTLVAAVATVTLRNPVYCAIWFGMSLLGTAGLFLIAGAQFLAVATIVVYAGAILVTFLFVLMLAQPKGRATYDRVSWEALVSAALGMVIVGILSMGVSRTLLRLPPAVQPTASAASVPTADGTDLPDAPLRDPLRNARPASASAAAVRAEEDAGQRTDGVLAPQHVALVGAELFGRHLIAVEVAGTLLLAALVGAAVIVGQASTRLPE